MQKEQRGKILVVVADKGGVGKTQTAVNLADWLSVIYQSTPVLNDASPGNVFLGDGDPQGDSTKCLWKTMPEHILFRDGTMISPMDERALPYTMTKLLTDPVIALKKCLYTNKGGLTLLPANHSLNEVDNSITPGQVRHLFTGWANELRTLFRWSIFDTRRAGSMLTLSLMKEADYVLMPMELEFLAMEDTELTIKNIELIKQLNPTLELFGILPTKLDYSTVSRLVKEELHQFLQGIEQKLEQRSLQEEGIKGDLLGNYSGKILPIGIKRSRFQRESTGAGVPVRWYLEMPALKLSPKQRQKAQEDTSGYARLAEMIAYHVPPELYEPEHEEQYQQYMKGRTAQ